MTTLQVVAGTTDGPSIGTNFFQSEILRNSVVHFILVNNTPENGLNPVPDYTFDTVTGKLMRGTNLWDANDKLIVCYSKCVCQ